MFERGLGGVRATQRIAGHGQLRRHHRFRLAALALDHELVESAEIALAEAISVSGSAPFAVTDFPLSDSQNGLRRRQGSSAYP